MKQSCARKRREATEEAIKGRKDGATSVAGLRGRADERLREKEFGLLDRLTHTGILERFPEQAELRRVLGKFYYRPPGGESWTDVILRLRSLVETLTREHAGQRVAIVTHQVIVLCFRYLLEKLKVSARHSPELSA